MSCTVIIFHFESLAYLRAVVRQIQKFQRDDLLVKIIIVDQSPNESYIKAIYAEFPVNEGLHILRTSPFGSGYSVDFVMKHVPITTDFICTIDVDTIPIHKNWLYAPIRLIEETNFTWVGVHAQIESAYGHMGNFFCMCQHYRIARTEVYRDLSLKAGFTKKDHRHRLSPENNEWQGWSDDAVIAHWWEDKYLQHNKFTLAVSHFLGSAPTEGMYGRYTDDLVFHFGFSYNWKMVRNQKECMGEEYIEWMRRMDNEGLTDELIEEILSKKKPLVAPIPRLCWDGTNKSIYAPNKELNELFDKLKAE